MLTKYEKLIIGQSKRRKNGPEWMKKNFPEIFRAAKKHNKLTRCKYCGEEIVKIIANFCRSCYSDFLKARNQEERDSNGKKLTATGETWLEAGWFSEEEINEVRFDGFLGVQDGYQCFLENGKI